MLAVYTYQQLFGAKYNVPLDVHISRYSILNISFDYEKLGTKLQFPVAMNKLLWWSHLDMYASKNQLTESCKRLHFITIWPIIGSKKCRLKIVLWLKGQIQTSAIEKKWPTKLFVTDCFIHTKTLQKRFNYFEIKKNMLNLFLIEQQVFGNFGGKHRTFFF